MTRFTTRSRRILLSRTTAAASNHFLILSGTGDEATAESLTSPFSPRAAHTPAPLSMRDCSEVGSESCIFAGEIFWEISIASGRGRGAGAKINLGRAQDEAIEFVAFSRSRRTLCDYLCQRGRDHIRGIRRERLLAEGSNRLPAMKFAIDFGVAR